MYSLFIYLNGHFTILNEIRVSQMLKKRKETRNYKKCCSYFYQILTKYFKRNFLLEIWYSIKIHNIQSIFLILGKNNNILSSQKIKKKSNSV